MKIFPTSGIFPRLEAKTEVIYRLYNAAELFR
jgi:hypothetical protein